MTLGLRRVLLLTDHLARRSMDADTEAEFDARLSGRLDEYHAAKRREMLAAMGVGEVG